MPTTSALLLQIVELLQRDVEAIAGGAAVSGNARPAIFGDGRPFRLGFANRTLGYGLPEKNRVAGAEMRGRLQKLGILRESGHEHFNGSLVIPVFNREGEVVRDVRAEDHAGLREGTPLHLYLPGEHRGVWNEEALVASKEIILCEALIDALTFWCAGFRHVTASYGVNGFTTIIGRPSRSTARSGSTSPMTATTPASERRNARRRADGDGDRMLPRGVPEGHGRERIRAESDASGEESGRAVEQCGVAGQRPAANGR